LGLDDVFGVVTAELIPLFIFISTKGSGFSNPTAVIFLFFSNIEILAEDLLIFFNDALDDNDVLLDPPVFSLVILLIDYFYFNYLDSLELDYFRFYLGIVDLVNLTELFNDFTL
jgi:hypothetical protein